MLIRSFGFLCVSLPLALGCSSSSSSPGNTADAGGTAHDSGGGGTQDSGGGTQDSGGAMLGPGAAFKCTSSGKDAWDTYGAAAFVKVNESIFTNVTNELMTNKTANLGDSFTKIGSGNPASTKDDLPTFKGNLAAFLVFAFGGPTSIMYTDGKTYQGPQDMVEAHTGLGITSAQYDYFVANIIVPALTSNGVPQGDVASCFAPVVTDASFKASIVGH